MLVFVLLELGAWYNYEPQVGGCLPVFSLRDDGNKSFGRVHISKGAKGRRVVRSTRMYLCFSFK